MHNTNFILYVGVCAAFVSAVTASDSTCEIYGYISTEGYRASNYMSEYYLPAAAAQCLTLDGGDAESISYSANYTFDPSSDWMVGFPGVSMIGWQRRPLDEHLSIPTTWEWSIKETADLKANVNYNIGGNQGCLWDLSWTISISLGSFGIDHVIDDKGQAGELIGDAIIAGVAFDVYRVNRPTGAPFIAWIFQARETQTSFEGDLVDFLQWPVDNQNARIGCISSLQAGLDIYGGSEGLFTTEKYSLKQILSD